MKNLVALPIMLAVLALPAHADNYSVPKNAAFEDNTKRLGDAWKTKTA